jgi:hypothetical protein
MTWNLSISIRKLRNEFKTFHNNLRIKVNFPPETIAKHMHCLDFRIITCDCYIIGSISTRTFRYLILYLLGHYGNFAET